MRGTEHPFTNLFVSRAIIIVRMRLVDTHVHAWSRDTPELPWKSDVLPPKWRGEYTHRELTEDMDQAGIDEAVIVTTPLYGRGVRANEYTVRSIEANPDRLYGVGLMDFFSDEATVRESVRRVVSPERMLGVRFHAALAYEEIPTEVDRNADWIRDDQLDPVFDELTRQDACAFVFPKAPQLTAVATLANEYPDIPFIVDHMAWLDEKTTPDDKPWIDFKDVAEYPNTYVKVSSLPRSSSESWPYSDLHVYVRRLVEWFGADRLMLGSDYPWMSSWASFEQCVSWIEEADFLSDADRRSLRYRTFDAVHG